MYHTVRTVLKSYQQILETVHISFLFVFLKSKDWKSINNEFQYISKFHPRFEYGLTGNS